MFQNGDDFLTLKFEPVILDKFYEKLFEVRDSKEYFKKHIKSIFGKRCRQTHSDIVYFIHTKVIPWRTS